MSSVYILYVFMLNIQAYAILPLENYNPFPTFKACQTIRNMINLNRFTQIGPYKFAARSAQCRKEQVQ